MLAAGNLPSGIVVFAHHLEGGAYGVITVVECRRLVITHFAQQLGDGARPNGPCDRGIAFRERNMHSRGFEDSITI